jgi:hypothetical protein
MNAHPDRPISRRDLLVGTTAAATRLLNAASVGDAPEFWSLAQAAAALHRRNISSEELTKLCLSRVKQLDPKLNSFITVTEEAAIAQARACDEHRARRAKSLNPLFRRPNHRSQSGFPGTCPHGGC